MTIVWDASGTRLFEKGIDHGVLYVDDKAVPWNGLISIEETFDETSSKAYLDGVKVFDIYSPGDFKATITAFTYPDDFSSCQGVESFSDSGFSVTGQETLLFDLSYRTLLGNDVSGLGYGYQIHLLYNLTAEPQDLDYTTYSASPEISNFRWSVAGTPERVDGFNPTSHVILDSQLLSDVLYLLTYIQDLLYGSPDSPDDVTIYLPPLDDLLFVIPYFNALVLHADSDTGFASYSVGYGDVTWTKVDGLSARLPRSRLTPSDIDGYYTLNSE